MTSIYFQNFYNSDNVYINILGKSYKLHKHKCISFIIMNDIEYYYYTVDGVDTFNKNESYYIDKYGNVKNYVTSRIYFYQTINNPNLLYSFIRNAVLSPNIALNYYILLTKQKHVDAMISCAKLYMSYGHNFEQMAYYYNMAIENGSIYAITCMGHYYSNRQKYNEMLLYFDKAARLGCKDALAELCQYYLYENTANEDKLLEYCDIAIKNNDAIILFTIGSNYMNVKKYDLMKYYCKMAAKLGNDDAMQFLGDYYFRIEKNYNKMKKYYYMNPNMSSYIMFQLGQYYHIIEQDYYKMKKYYFACLKKRNTVCWLYLYNYYDEFEHNYENNSDNYAKLHAAHPFI